MSYNFNQIWEKCLSFNIEQKPEEFKGLLDEPGNMLSKYASDGNYMGKENAKKIKESNAMMTWAKFNSYFIFQKVRSNDDL